MSRPPRAVTQPGPPYRVTTPVARRTLEWEKEDRFELPCLPSFEHLLYAGVIFRPSWEVFAHEHEHFELCFLAGGRGWFALDGRLYNVGPGDLFLTKPGEAHSGAAFSESPFQLFYFGFKASGMPELELAFYKLGERRIARDDADGRIGRTATQIIAELVRSPAFSAFAVQGLFLQLLVAVLRCFAAAREADQSAPASLSPALERVLSILHSDSGYKHTTGTLAAAVHLSRSHLAREFKAHFGVPLGAYARGLRADRAKSLLGESDRTITEIAEHLGFPSIHSFSTFFKEQVGVAPRTYRLAARKGRSPVGA